MTDKRIEETTDEHGHEVLDKAGMVRAALLDVMREWSKRDKEKGGTGFLPVPMPPRWKDAVDWWLNIMQEPETDDPGDAYHEIPSTTPGTKGGAVYGYLTRVKSALAAYLCMGDADRQLITEGVITEGVPWRGDVPEIYVKVLEESAKMRKMGADAYITQARASLREKFGLVLR